MASGDCVVAVPAGVVGIGCEEGVPLGEGLGVGALGSGVGCDQELAVCLGDPSVGLDFVGVGGCFHVLSIGPVS